MEPQSSPPSRWQQLYPSTNATSDKIEDDIIDNNIKRDLEAALDIEDEDYNLQQWIANIQSTEDTLARIKFQGIDHVNIVPDEEPLGQCSDADCILEELEAMLCEHECDVSIIDSQPLVESKSLVEIMAIEGGEKQDKASVTEELDERMMLKAIIQHRTAVQSRCFRSWFKIAVDEQLRIESLIEWFTATTAQRCLRSNFQIWMQHCKLLRTKCQEFQKQLSLHLMEKLFCHWFNNIKIEVDQARNCREIILKGTFLRLWKQSILASKTDIMKAEEFHKHKLMHRTLHALVTSSKDSRESRSKRLQEDRKKSITARKHKAAGIIHDLSRNVQGSDSKSGSKDLNGSSEDKENNFNGASLSRKSNQKGRLGGRGVLNRNKKFTSTPDRRNDKDEEERRSYLRKKREEKQRKIAKEREFERLKQAWKLAKMHHELTVQKYCFSVRWADYMHERRLKYLKADNFWRDSILSACIKQFGTNVECKKQHRLELERRRFSQADEFHCYRVCETVLNGWRKTTIHSYKILYPRIQFLGFHYKKKRFVQKWISTLAHQKLKNVEWDRIANITGKSNTLKWACRRWKAGAETERKERVEEEKVKKKWLEVREWLAENN